jgi:hypothetical protein
LLIKWVMVQPTTSFAAGTSSGRFHENPPHRLGRRRKKVPPILPVLPFFRIHEPQVGLVDQTRGIQGLPPMLVPEPLSRQPTQLLVDNGKKLARGVGIPRLNSFDDLRYLTQSPHAPDEKTR